MEAFEKSNEVEIMADGGNLPDLFGAHDRGPLEIMGRGDFDIDDIQPNIAKMSEDMNAQMSADINAALDSPKFNRKRGSRLSKIIDSLGDGVRDTLKSVKDFRLNMSDMHNLLANIMPLMFTFIMAMPAAITALMTLAAAAISAAAAFGAIGILGAVGSAMGDSGGMPEMEDFTEMFEEVRDDLFEAFAPLAERLAPLFEDGLDGLEKFFNEVAAEGDSLMALRDSSREFGRFLIDYIPGALSSMAGTVKAMAPVFGAIGEYLQDTQILRTFVNLAMESMPQLKALAGMLIDVAYALTKTSVGFVIVTNAVLQLFGAIASIFNLFGITNEMLGVIVGSLLSLASIVGILSFLVGNAFVGALGAGVVAMWNFWAGLIATNNALGYLAVTNIGRAVTSMVAFVKSLIVGQTSLISFAASAFTATGALAAFLTVASLGVLVGLGALAMGAAEKWLGLADGIDSATKSLKEYDSVAGRGGDGMNPYRDGGAPRSGAGSSFSTSSGSSVTNYTVESTGNRNKDNSNLSVSQWRMGRTSGGQA
ncbi:hypothetical protein [Natrinema sp. DC36]|uniref:hypothetical protein n=1 Tax=Natrinema sp. DC36 TaxID=2878680 RepID=UPI001CEFEBBE|nr:hypothetical protein [Natrinema sp. DC36]